MSRATTGSKKKKGKKERKKGKKNRVESDPENRRTRRRRAAVVVRSRHPHAIHTFIMHFLHFGTGINKSQTADMYAPSTVNGDTMTGELSSMSDEKSDVNFDANDYVVSAISQYVLSNK